MNTQDTEQKTISVSEFQAMIDAGRPQYANEQELILAKAKAHDLIGSVCSIMDGHEDEWFISTCSKVYFPCINCNDFFAWGCADAEEVTEENFPILKQSIEEVEAIAFCDEKSIDEEEEKDRSKAYRYGGLLFCARVAKIRPQGAYYEHLPKCLWEKFNECGEKREIKFGNPRANPSDL